MTDTPYLHIPTKEESDPDFVRYNVLSCPACGRPQLQVGATTAFRPAEVYPHPLSVATSTALTCARCATVSLLQIRVRGDMVSLEWCASTGGKL